MLACLLSHYCCSDLFVYECVTDKSSSERRWILSLITFTHSDFKWKLLNYYHMIMNWDSTQKLNLQLNKTCKMMYFSAISRVLYGEYLSESTSVSNFSSSNRLQDAVQNEAESCTPGFHPDVSPGRVDSSSSFHSLDIAYQSFKQICVIQITVPNFVSPIFSSPTCLNRGTCRNILGLWPVKCENKTLQPVTSKSEVWHRHWIEFLI